ncbi:MAG: leucine-rich repeat protein [Muribaculaceae bacterium]
MAFLNCKDLISVELPKSVATVGWNAFEFSTSLAKVDMPKVITIDNYAFLGSSLVKVDMPEVITIGEKAFQGSSLAEVNMPKVTKIGASAFRACELRSIHIPKSVLEISQGAFAYNSKLMEVFFIGDKSPTIEFGAFDGCHSALEMYVPSVENYGFGTPYVTFDESQFKYDGTAPVVRWSNNLAGYNVTVEEPAILEKGAGTHTVNFKATYSNGIDLTLDIPYTYTITPAPLTLSVKDCEREYGEDNPSFTCSMTGFVEGENAETIQAFPTYTCEANRRSDVGEYSILASLDAPNYEVTYDYGTLSVVKAPISVGVKSASKVYGDDVPQMEFVYTGLRNGETRPQWDSPLNVESSVDKTTPCGTYPINISGGSARNYTVTQYLPGELTVTKRDLTVKANDCQRLYREENPELDLTYSGFVNGDGEKSLSSRPTLQCSATVESNAGDYPIVVSGGKADNYNLICSNGTLTVRPLTVGFKATESTVVYDNDEDRTPGEWFWYYPEVTGEYNKEDFNIVVWALDVNEKYHQHETSIAGGNFAGKYVSHNAETYVNKYIYNLVPTGKNPNVVASPARAYVNIVRGSNDLQWDDEPVVTVGLGETVELDIKYKGDPFCSFNTAYDEELIAVGSEANITDHAKWTVKGLKLGETRLTFGITSRKNDWGFINYNDSPVLSRTIRVVPESGIDDVVSDGDAVKVSVVAGSIVIVGAGTDDIAEVYNLQGRLVATSYDGVISGLSSGVYVVRVAGRVFKVAL